MPQSVARGVVVYETTQYFCGACDFEYCTLSNGSLQNQNCCDTNLSDFMVIVCQQWRCQGTTGEIPCMNQYLPQTLPQVKIRAMMSLYNIKTES